MKKYLKIILTILSMSHQRATMHRADYALRIIRAFLDVGVAYITISVFYTQSPTILGWNKWEALVVYGFFQIISTTVFIFTGHGISTIAREIIWGSLDRIIIQPLDSQFSVSFKTAYITSVFRLLFGVIVLIISMVNLNLSYSIFKIFMLIITIVSSVVIYYSLNFGVSVLSFWTFSYELGELMYTIASTSRFPTDFFSKGIKTIMHILPLAFISTVPAQALLGKSYKLAILSPFVAFFTFFLTRKLWKLGLKSYQSASS